MTEHFFASRFHRLPRFSASLELPLYDFKYDGLKFGDVPAGTLQFIRKWAKWPMNKGSVYPIWVMLEKTILGNILTAWISKAGLRQQIAEVGSTKATTNKNI